MQNDDADCRFNGNAITIDTIDAMLAKRKQRLQTFRRTLAGVQKMNTLAEDVGDISLGSLLQPVSTDCLLVLSVDEAMARLRENLDAGLWQSLFRQSELVRLMDAFTRRTWSVQHSTPFSVPVVNRRALIGEFLPDKHRKQELICERAVNLYRWLSWDGDRQVPLILPKSARVKHCVRWLRSSALLNQVGEIQLVDLEEMFLLLDSKPFPEMKHSLPRQYDSFLAKGGNKTIPYQDHYFTIKCYSNGSLLIQLKRRDLVNELNRLVFDK